MEGTESALVEVAPGEFAVFGGLNLAGIDIVPAPLLPPSSSGILKDGTARLIGLGNAGLQGAQALGAFQGLVRLSPQTIEMLKAGATPMSNGAFNLGSLTDASGHIVHTVQWTAAGAVGLASAAATLGPALALVAIQWQLAKITELVGENLRLTDALLAELRTERWATVEGHQQGLLKMLAEARQIGAVNAHIWQNVHGSEMELRSIRAGFKMAVEAHLAGLHRASTPAARREFVDHHGDAVLRDVQGLLQAQSAWFTYQAIRAGHIAYTIDEDPTAPAHLEVVTAEAREEHAQDLRNAAELIDALVRRASAMVDAKGAGTLPFGRKRRAARDVAEAGKVLRKQLRKLHAGWNLSDPPVQTPLIAAFKDGVAPEAVLRILRWHLDPGERLLALAAAQDQSGSWAAWDWRLQDADVYVAVTDSRIVVAKKSKLAEAGTIEGTMPVEDIRYVRYLPSATEPKATKAHVRVIGKDRDLVLRFPEWAGKPEAKPHVDDFVQLLQSQMVLPAAEVVARPAKLEAAPAELGLAVTDEGD